MFRTATTARFYRKTTASVLSLPRSVVQAIKSCRLFPAKGIIPLTAFKCQAGHGRFTLSSCTHHTSPPPTHPSKHNFSTSIRLQTLHPLVAVFATIFLITLLMWLCGLYRCFGSRCIKPPSGEELKGFYAMYRGKKWQIWPTDFAPDLDKVD